MRRSLLLALLLLPSLAACHAAPARSDARDERAPYGPDALTAIVDVSAVALSPDARELAFASDRSGAYELWTFGLGEGDAPVQRTDAHQEVSAPVYSPDGATLVFEMDEGGDERTDFFVLRRGAPAPERLARTDTAEHEARFSPDGKQLAFVADPDRPFRFNVHVMDLATGAVRQLTHEPVNVAAPRWSRDGRTIAATVTPDDQKGELCVIDVASGAVRKVAPPRADGIAWPVGFLENGVLVVNATNDAGFMQLARADLAHGGYAWIGEPQWDVEHAGVADDGTILSVRNVHGDSEVAVVAPEGGPARTLAAGGVVGDVALAARAPVAALLRETARRPVEIALADLRTGQVATAVPAVLGAVDLDRLPSVESRAFPSGALSVDAFLWHPPVARLGTPPPAVVWIHGGPNSQMRPYFAPNLVALAEAGFLVVAPNYRGSTGYGRAFEDLNNGDWGGGDLDDVAAVVDALAAEGALDPARTGVSGWSYGGYMTLRAITAQPERWRAAVEWYGMPDLVADYRLTADRFGTWYETEMAGTPDSAPERYRERSPIHALDRVSAPLLVLQGENDTNVPRAESDEVVAKLRERGAIVDYVVYPDEGHGFSHREHRLDAMARMVEFFRAHLAR